MSNAGKESYGVVPTEGSRTITIISEPTLITYT
jgi:hypothetical protein